jgi:glycosyltransferase involved in cell wall biosynthesis
MHTIIRNGDHRKRKELQKMIRSPGFIGLVTLTTTMANHFKLLEPSHLSEQQIWVAHCGGDPHTSIEPTPLPRHTAGWQIAYAGTLSERKGLALVEHIANVLTHHDFHIFGGNKEDTEYWRQRIPWPHVHFHGFIAPGQLAERLAAVDLCLLPNQQVPWNKTGEIISSPLKLFDYMALGKTILASDFPEIREVVSNEEAVLLPFDEPSQWIDAIEGLGQNQAQTLGRRALQLFHSHYTRQKRYEKLLRSIAHCLAS